MSSAPSHHETPERTFAVEGAAFRPAGLGGLHGPVRVDGAWAIDRASHDPIAQIEQLMREHARPACAWALLLSYELGGWVEPTARSNINDETGFPLCIAMRLPDPSADPIGERRNAQGGFVLGRVQSHAGRATYMSQVERVRDYIAAGDIYQANIAHRLRCAFDGDPGACAEALIEGASPRYGASMRFVHNGTDHTVCSVSPELFVRVNREQGSILTEPMKGTRPLGTDLSELEHSDKDRAELNMITDLMRNDIGRVCTLGSVRVRAARQIEPHASGVLQASSVVEGQLRAGLGFAELVRAIFPPGSITGAPKVRAMQIIDEIEQSPRRSYCGSMMHIDPDGSIEASVTIRTAHIWGESDPDRPGSIRAGQLAYPVGAGIVADSNPEEEWAETLVKAAALERILGVQLDHLA